MGKTEDNILWVSEGGLRSGSVSSAVTVWRKKMFEENDSKCKTIQMYHKSNLL